MRRIRRIRVLIIVATALTAAPVPVSQAQPDLSVAPDGFKPLFNGLNLAGWRVRGQDKPNRWSAQDGILVNLGPGADLLTEGVFNDFEFRCEYKIPSSGRSGVYLRGRYVIWIADDAGAPPGFQSSGAKGKKTLVAVYLEDNDGKLLNTTTADKTYATKEGHFRICTNVVPPDNDSSFEDVALFVPYSALPLVAGRNQFHFQVYISCDGKWLAMNHPFRSGFWVDHHGP